MSFFFILKAVVNSDIGKFCFALPFTVQLFLLPFCKMGDLVAFIRSGQSLIFLLFLAGMGLILAFGVGWTQKHSKVNAMDVTLFMAGLYFLVNSYFVQEIGPFSFRAYDLIGLGLFYLFVRRVDLKYYWILMAILVLGGLSQVIYGELQLYGFYPSMHLGFPVTGSFFNPGPYAGYLVVVFPAALGLYFFSDKLGSGPVELREEDPPSKDGMASPPRRIAMTEAYSVKPWVGSLVKYISLATVLGILLVLPVANSRAAWLAVIVSGGFLAYHRYRWNRSFRRDPDVNVPRQRRRDNSLFRFLDSKIKKGFAAVLLVVVMSTAFLGVYLIKKDSADGRLLIWKASWELVKENPWFGIGFDRFKAGYMEAQADYFRTHPDDPAIPLADDVVYAFNEGVQLLVEQGVVGFGLAVVLLVVAFRSSRYHQASLREVNHSSNIRDLNDVSIFPLSFRQKEESLSLIVSGRDPSLPRDDTKNTSMVGGTACFARMSGKTKLSHPTKSRMPHSTLAPFALRVAQAGLLSLLVFGMFSYPSHILPIKICGVVYLAILAGHSKQIFKIPAFSKCIRWLFSGVIMILAVGIIWHTNRVYQATQDWKDALSYYERGAYSASLEHYEKVLPVFARDGQFLCNYGKALSIAGEHEEAVVILEEAKNYLSNTIIQTALGDSYKALGMYAKAEVAYQLGADMLPDRFYPKYLLAKLYHTMGEEEKMKSFAQYLVEKEPKVPSQAVREIKEEMRGLLGEMGSLE